MYLKGWFLFTTWKENIGLEREKKIYTAAVITSSGFLPFEDCYTSCKELNRVG